MKLYFTTEEKKAVLSLAIAMECIDGVTRYSESCAIVEEALKMGLDPITTFEDCSSIKPNDAIGCVSQMSFEKKKYVSSLLYKVMVIDGQIHPSETSLLFVISEKAGLPKMMSPTEINQYLQSVDID